MRKTLIGIVALVSIAPASAQTMEEVLRPGIGVEATVGAGGEVFQKSRIYTVQGAILGGDTHPGSYLRGRGLSEGTELVPSSTTDGSYKVCVPSPGTFSPEGPCLLDKDNDGLFDKQSRAPQYISQDLKAPAPYSKHPIQLEGYDSFKQVILFQGATSDSLRFSYREFKDNMARPAFTEDLTIPREAFPAMIMVKNLQMEVLGVSGMGLRYRIVAMR